uniref:G-patch domain-containing protein n=1 Tax=Syphacia muris TaxID=451379 RepID=A0A0N5AM51_9BILA
MDIEEDEGMESFEIDDRDIEYALNPGARRGFSKNQQLYGIWADKEDSDEEDAHAGFGSFGTRKKNKNYSAPVNFVSGGIKGQKKSSEEIEEKQGEGSIAIQYEKKRRAERREVGGNVFAGMRTSSTHASVDPDKFADWTKYSKSDVIMGMMKKMGFVPGQGLGIRKQGIVEPVQAVVRPGRAAVGAYGKESKGPKFGENSADVHERADGKKSDGTDRRRNVQRGNWKKSNVVKPPVYQYKTIEEVISEGGVMRKRNDLFNSGVKVIDMTGKEQKVYSGYDAYASKTRFMAEVEDEHLAFDIPELSYNINTLLELTEDTIRHNDKQLNYLKDQTVSLENDRKVLSDVVLNAKVEQKRMKEVLALLEKFSVGLDCEELTLEKCRDVFYKMKKDYFEEYRLFGLDVIAAISVIPLIRNYFSTWNPLDSEQLNYGYSLILEWKNILTNEEQTNFSRTKSLDNLQPFERLLWNGWMPTIRAAALKWSPRDDTLSMLHVVEKWLPLLPIWMRENLLEQVIIPRISTQVDEWNPMVDHIPIHTWLHPWLDIMGDRLQPVFSPIRQKLAKALSKWIPTDYSAISILRPWKQCFEPATMSAFLAMNIVPKLEKALWDMEYDPTKNTRYEEFYATLMWIELLGLETVAAILVKSFFPKWHQTLCIWLDAPQVVMSEVAMWYNEWKSRFPVELSALHVIREQLTRALMAVTQAQQGIRVSRQPPPPPPPLDSLPEVLNPPPPPCIPPPLAAHLSFKVLLFSYVFNVEKYLIELLEMKARELGVLFLPQSERYRDGRPVYYFGNASIYIDRNAIFCYSSKTQQWEPVSLDYLLSIC